VLEPDVLLLDEPFAALDPLTRESLVDTFHRLQRETRVTTVLVTHDRLEALRLGHRIAVMAQGAILQIGSLEEVFSQPINEMVASFVGIETILQGQIARQSAGMVEVQVGAAATVLAVASLAVGSRVTLCIRPEEVTLLAASAESAPSSARNHFSAMVQRIVPWGAAFKVHLDCGFPLVAFVTRPSLELLDLREGKSIAAAFKATAVHVIPT
jgi:tungstate transport system ATP-binding protein